MTDWPRDDESIARNVRDAITWDERLGAEDIQVEVEDGRVRLTGAVRRVPDVSAASDDAWQVKGVCEVRNELDVVGAETLDDRDIASDLEKRMLELGVDLQNLVIDVAGGVVTITGSVDDNRRKREILAIAREVPGVVDVVDRLIASKADGRSDSEIRTDVVAVITRDSRIGDATRIGVSVLGGGAILEGTVDSDADRRAAEEDAWFVSGVRVVDNRLRMSARSPRRTSKGESRPVV